MSVMESSAESLAIINTIADTLHRSLDFRTIAEQAIDLLVQFFNAPLVTFYSVSDERDYLELVADHGVTQKGKIAGARISVEHSLSGAAINQRKILVSGDIATDEQIAENVREPLLQGGFTNALIVPIFFQQDVIGCLNLLYRKKIIPTDHEIDTLETIAKTIGLAMANARYVAEIKAVNLERRRTEVTLSETEALYNIANSLMSMTTMAVLLQQVVDIVVETLPAHVVIISTVDIEKRQSLQGYVNEGFLMEQLSSFEELWTGLPGAAMRELQPILSSKRGGDSRESEESRGRRDIFGGGAVLVVPLHYQGHVLGTITAVNQLFERDFTEADAKLLTTIASQVSIAMNNQLLFEQIKGSLNRRGRQVEISTQIAQQIASAADLDVLFQQVVDLVQARLGYYYVQLFMVEQEKQEKEEGDAGYIVLQAGAGEIGRQLKAQNHRIPLSAEKSIIAHAARSRDPVLVAEVTTDPTWLPNMLLPETLTELAIPIKLGQVVLGVLDVQNATPESLSDEDSVLLVGLCGQIAVAIDYRRTEMERELLIEELEMKNAELERFTYTVSHDLKSPLVTMRGFLGFLERDIAAGAQERAQRDLMHVHEAIDQMDMFLKDLLELSRVGRVLNEPQLINFGDVVKKALAVVSGQLQSREITMVLPDKWPDIYGDERRLVEVVQNLVDNSVKFLGDQAEPIIELGAIEGEETVFFVQDNGIGIDPKYCRKVFRLFDRLQTGTEGSGVGLALVKRIIEAHNGRVWIESELGKGATFYFTLALSD